MVCKGEAGTGLGPLGRRQGRNRGDDTAQRGSAPRRASKTVEEPPQTLHFTHLFPAKGPSCVEGPSGVISHMARYEVLNNIVRGVKPFQVMTWVQQAALLWCLTPGPAFGA